MIYQTKKELTWNIMVMIFNNGLHYDGVGSSLADTIGMFLICFVINLCENSDYPKEKSTNYLQ